MEKNLERKRREDENIIKMNRGVMISRESLRVTIDFLR